MFHPTGSNPQKPPVEISNSKIERELEWSSRALSQIAKGIQQGLVNKALLLGLLLLVAESLLITHFQSGPALAVLRDTPPLAVLTGTLANVTPILIPVAGMALCAFGVLDLTGKHSKDGLNQLSLGLLVLLVALLFIDRSLVPGRLFLSLIMVTASAVALGIWDRTRDSQRYDDNDLVDMLRGSLKAIVFLFAFGSIITNPAVLDNLQRPYLPAEEIVIAQGKSTESMVGYVLSMSGGSKWTAVLLEEGRSVQILETESITNRALCALDESSSSQPWWNLFKSAQDGNIPLCNE